MLSGRCASGAAGDVLLMAQTRRRLTRRPRRREQSAQTFFDL